MDFDDLTQLFAAEILARRDAIEGGQRLVHYTSAESAYKIITGKQIWLRSASVMNDFSEISHGIECLLAAWSSTAGVAFQNMLERLRPGLRNELAELFDGHTLGFRHATYITSLSEHADDEDELGRLSMWRAYGGRAGVALVLNTAAFAGATDLMGVYSAPVYYRSQGQFVSWFQGWAGRILAAEEALKAVSADTVRDLLFHMFRTFVMCTKHPGFAEEREWRVFHSPAHEAPSHWIEYATETIGGIPQPLVKLSLKDDPDQGIVGVAPRTLINRLIIGPCEYPIQVRAAMHRALEDAGFQDPMSILWMSLIPLRQG